MKNVKIMAIYPPGEIFQRGEDRCQANLDKSTSSAARACNDLGFVAAILKRRSTVNLKFETIIKDYASELFSFDDLIQDFTKNKPDFLFLSTTNATIFKDIQIVKELKNIVDFDFFTILKGALFFDLDMQIIDLYSTGFSVIDYLIGGEVEFIIGDLIQFHIENKFDQIIKIPGIFYKEKIKQNKTIESSDDVPRENNSDNKEQFKYIWHKTTLDVFNKNLDSLPFPDRSLMNNSLYLRPDNKRPMATIATSRGCSSNCIYCLTPIISGKKLRLRSVENIFDEIMECYQKYKIKDFFFKSDTFTLNKKWVISLCNLLIKSGLNKKIEWVANSRTKPLDFEILKKMKEAGCQFVAFGFESGSDKSMSLIKKGASVGDSIKAASLAKRAGLKVFGFYMIGFPWESKVELEETKNLIYKMDADFIEIHIATPYYGTELYDIVSKENLIYKQDSILGANYFSEPITKTHFLSKDELVKFRKNILLFYHLRPLYILKKIWGSITKPRILLSYFEYGLKLIKNLSSN